MLVLKGLVGLHRTVQLQLLQITGQGIDLDYRDIEWFALESNRGATPHPRSGAAERSNPTSKERQLCGRRRAKRSYSMFKVRTGDSSKVRSIGCTLLEQP